MEIQDEFNTFGIDSFGIDVLKTFDRDNMKQRHTEEAYFIDLYDAVRHGFNSKHQQT